MNRPADGQATPASEGFFSFSQDGPAGAEGVETTGKGRGGLGAAWAAAGLLLLAAACGRGQTGASRLDPTASMEGEAASAPSLPMLDPSPAETASPSAPEIVETLTIRGWFTIVWNDQAHTFITDDEGTTVEVLLDESLSRPLGGPLALDRERVVITAVVLNDRPDQLRVMSIVREGEE